MRIRRPRYLTISLSNWFAIWILTLAASTIGMATLVHAQDSDSDAIAELAQQQNPDDGSWPGEDPVIVTARAVSALISYAVDPISVDRCRW